MTRRVGILGGTFDPIHCGHVDIGVAVERELHLTQVLVVPARTPPHRSGTVASSFHRFAMVALTVVGRPTWRASDIELQREGPSYTSTTLNHLHAAGYRPSELFFIVGADAFAEVATWKDYPAILDQANFAVVSRTAFPVSDLRGRLPSLAARMVEAGRHAGDSAGPSIFLIDARTTDVSSTAIRQQLAAAQSIAGLVTPSVETHIAQHNLYAVAHDGSGPDESMTRSAGRLHDHN